jgi:hypothetical protein
MGRWSGAAGAAAALVSVAVSWQEPLTSGRLLSLAFLCLWLAVAVVVPFRGLPDRVTLVTSAVLVAFPMAFTGLTAGNVWLDRAWQAAGTVSLVLFLYLFPQARFWPPWSVATCLMSCAYLVLRALHPALAGWIGDDVVFPATAALPLVLQARRHRTASNPVERRQVKIVVRLQHPASTLRTRLEFRSSSVMISTC